MIRDRTYKCFVIMPFGSPRTETEQKFNDIFTYAILPISELPGFNVSFPHADASLRDFDLVRSVHRLLDEADFCLVDITGLNPNVIYEMGYARAKDKETIVISQDGPPYPVDISGRVITRYFVKDDMDSNDWDILSQTLANRVERAIAFTQSKASRSEYEVPGFERRPSAEINFAIQTAKETIDILQMDLDSAKSDYLDSLVQALRDNRQLRLRILTLDPDGNFIAWRARQLGIPVRQYRPQLHRNIREVMSALSEFPLQFSLRIYNDYPTQITFNVDDVFYICTIAMNFRSRELCTFRLRRDTAGVERSYANHFYAIWGISTEYQSI